MNDHPPKNGTRPEKEYLGRQSEPGMKALKPEEIQPRRKPDPHRMRILRSLPLEIKQSLTREEAEALLYGDTWPDSLLFKLKDFLVEEEENH